jgi:hypothetical protein
MGTRVGGQPDWREKQEERKNLLFSCQSSTGLDALNQQRRGIFPASSTHYQHAVLMVSFLSLRLRHLA